MITKNAYAKINLYLDVLDKMENGYHNIKSVMQQVSLCDTLSLEVFDVNDSNCIEINCNNPEIKCDSSNLIYKATSLFLENANISGKKCVFHLTKSIPISAGMAGGSTDGATALLLLNEWFGFPFSKNELLAMGVRLGADFAFCIEGGTAVCEGIGEKIRKITPLKDVFMVCAIDNSSVSTPVAFSMLDERYGTSCTESGNLKNMVDAINTKSLTEIASCLYNKFESVIVEKNLNINIIKDTLIRNGAIGALMSGSGPSVFGIFDDEEKQALAFSALKKANINAFLCKTI